MSGKKTPVKEEIGKKGKGGKNKGGRTRRSKPGFHLETPKERAGVKKIMRTNQASLFSPFANLRAQV